MEYLPSYVNQNTIGIICQSWSHWWTNKNTKHDFTTTTARSPSPPQKKTKQNKKKRQKTPQNNYNKTTGQATTPTPIKNDHSEFQTQGL